MSPLKVTINPIVTMRLNPGKFSRFCNTALICLASLLYFFCVMILLMPATIYSLTLFHHPETTTTTRSTIVDSRHFQHRKLQQQNQRNFTKLDDLFISVKTTRIFHKSRLEIILNTWYTLAKNQTFFFTDATAGDVYHTKLGDHMVNTNCSVSHNRKALCCKMSVEYDYFIASNKKWWCHFDDDNYVNVPRLLELLGRYNPLDDWYLGKTSIKQPLEIEDHESKEKIQFSFATGGAGFCVSRALALKMMPVASDGRLISVGDQIRLPDDVTIGYIIEHVLGKKLTQIQEFHSHLEPMAVLPKDTLRDQVSFSYSGNKFNRNVLSLNQIDTTGNDPTRFYTLHCFLFPKRCNNEL